MRVLKKTQQHGVIIDDIPKSESSEPALAPAPDPRTIIGSHLSSNVNKHNNNNNNNNQNPWILAWSADPENDDFKAENSNSNNSNNNSSREVNRNRTRTHINHNRMNRVNKPEPETFTCKICLTLKSMDDVCIISGCKHRVCRVCMRQHILSSVERAPRSRPKCPFSAANCSTELSQHNDIQLVLSQSEYIRVNEILNSAAIRTMKDVKHCLTPDCTNRMILEHTTRFPCARCGRSWCVECQTPWHAGMECAQASALVRASQLQQSRAASGKKADEQNAEFYRQNTEAIKICPGCGERVEKNGGCNHIACNCGTHWCWPCHITVDHTQPEFLRHFHQHE